jgi:hypothetical protein
MTKCDLSLRQRRFVSAMLTARTVAECKAALGAGEPGQREASRGGLPGGVSGGIDRGDPARIKNRRLQDGF